jgi:hypothetical protein
MEASSFLLSFLRSFLLSLFLRSVLILLQPHFFLILIQILDFTFSSSLCSRRPTVTLSQHLILQSESPADLSPPFRLQKPDIISLVPGLT